MKLLSNILALLIVVIPIHVFAQNYNIGIELPSEAGKKVTLAYHYLDKIYLSDTTRLNENGMGNFKGDSLLHQGLYKIMVDQDHHFDFLLGADQELTIRNTAFSTETMEVTGAVETEEFVNYMRFLSDLRKESTDLNSKINQLNNPDEKAKLREQLNGLTPKLHQYWFSIKEKYPDRFLSQFLLANYVPEPDVSKMSKEVQSNDSLLLIAKFYYQQKHFWDYLDYTDPRFLYTPVFKPKLETWFNKVLCQSYDSIREPVLEMIEEVKPNPRIFQFVASWFLNAAINSNVIGMDALFVELAEKYYLSGDAFWATDETIKTIRENVIFLQNNLIGKKAPDLTMKTIEGEDINLHKIDAKVTVVLIYEPNCSHCAEFVPKFHDEIYKKYNHKGLAVYAIYSMDDKNEWNDFLLNHNLFDWINVWDPEHLTNFKVLYDGRQTPGVYVLDENKTIVTKKLGVEQFEFILNNLLSN